MQQVFTKHCSLLTKLHHVTFRNFFFRSSRIEALVNALGCLQTVSFASSFLFQRNAHNVLHLSPVVVNFPFKACRSRDAPTV